MHRSAARLSIRHGRRALGPSIGARGDLGVDGPGGDAGDSAGAVLVGLSATGFAVLGVVLLFTAG